MIGKLTGSVDTLLTESLILDVQGVGYLVSCSSRTLEGLVTGTPASLLIETWVREDQIRLFGFSTSVERDWFTLLLTVQGVGAKVALAILSTLRTSELGTAIAMSDKAMVARAPGVGPKVAQRIVTELKDKVPMSLTIDPAAVRLSDQIGEGRVSGPLADAVSALTNLGYGMPQASSAVARVQAQAGEEASVSTLIRLALKELSQ